MMNLTNNYLTMMMILMLTASSILAENHSSSNQPSSGRPFVEKSKNIRITGCVDKNVDGEFLRFDLKIGNDYQQYTVEGSTSSDQGIFRTDNSYDGVDVKKVTHDGSIQDFQRIRNTGTVKIYPRKRKMSGVSLAGVGLSGYTVDKMFTGSLTMYNLLVNGRKSNGRMFYNVFNGRFTCPTGKCHFGDYHINSTKPGSKILLNRDNFINRNRMRVHMSFGDFRLNGNIKFTDITDSTTIDLGDDDDVTITSVTNRRGCFNVSVTKSDGSAPKFSKQEGQETKDDVTTRNLIAWLELMLYDIIH